jgi:hypothetical protein
MPEPRRIARILSIPDKPRTQHRHSHRRRSRVARSYRDRCARGL